jgi:hypothetical protein
MAVVRDPNDTFIVISATPNLATQSSNFVREMIEQHPLTKHLMPTDDTLWQKTAFTVIRPHPQRNPSCQALALGGDITGLHASELIGDDLETKRNSETAESRSQLRERLKGLTSISRKITWIGTPHAGQETIYKKMRTEVDKYNPLIISIYTEDEDGNRTYAWPARFGEEEVKS